MLELIAKVSRTGDFQPGIWRIDQSERLQNEIHALIALEPPNVREQRKRRSHVWSRSEELRVHPVVDDLHVLSGNSSRHQIISCALAHGFERNSTIDG